jgi:hypothetical protein
MDVAVQFQDRSCPVGMTRAAQVTWTRGHSTGQRGRHMARCKTRSPRQAHRRSSRRHTGLRSRSQKHQGNKTLPCTCPRRRLSSSPPRASSDLADRAPAPRSKPNQIKSNQFESTQIKSNCASARTSAPHRSGRVAARRAIKAGVAQSGAREGCARLTWPCAVAARGAGCRTSTSAGAEVSSTAIYPCAPPAHYRARGP